ncbi:hypothetical protein BRD01_02225 [Halobacteriales archaeon QS_8_65_32]|nr:MAG: hypothetical protein BRD01_02225 [Halobacteriales archaeon QS_8_65_32]
MAERDPLFQHAAGPKRRFSASGSPSAIEIIDTLDGSGHPFRVERARFERSTVAWIDNTSRGGQDDRGRFLSEDDDRPVVR